MFTVPTPSVPLFSRLPGDLSVEIMAHMDVDQLVRLKATCSVADQYVAAVIHTRSRKLLDHGLRSYDAFIAMLAQCRAVVGGISALYILFPYHGRPPFVDIFVPDDTYDDLLEYLLFEEGFSYRKVEPGSSEEERGQGHGTQDSHQEADHSEDADEGDDEDDEDDGLPHIPPAAIAVPSRYPPGVSVMHRFTRTEGSKDGFSIILVRSTTISPLLAITSELHSGLFNYVSPRGFCSSYPAMNRERHALLNPLRLDDDFVPPKYLRPALAAFARNGWTLRVVPVADANAPRCRGVHSIGCAAATRYFGDRHCTYGRTAPIRLRHLQPVDNTEETITVVWWRGGVTCAWKCHSGTRVLVPGARVCLREVAEGV